MNGMLVGVLAAVFFVGVALVVWGRRGRRLNDHPQCRDCGFDLEGVYPASPTCPECGAGLKRPGAVRDGVRKRMAWMLVAGVLTALLPLAPMVVLLYAAVTGTNIAKYTPTGVLLWQTRISSAAVNKGIADELIDRLIKKQLDKGQTDAVTERVLAMQADRSVAWEEVWGDVIERLNLNGDLSQAQLGRFYQQAASLTGRSRAAVRPGDALPVVIKAEPGRVGTKSQLLAMVWLDSAKLGDDVLRKPAARGGGGGGLFGGGGGSGELSFYMFGSKANAGWTSGQLQEQATSLTVPKTTKPGPTTLTVTVLCRVSDYQMGWNNGRIKAGDPGVSTFTITQQVEVLAEGAEPIMRVPPTPASEKAMRALLGQAAVTANVSASGSALPFFGGGISVSRTVSAQLTVDKPPTPFAFDVFVRLRDKETRIGEIASAPTVAGLSGRGYAPYGATNAAFYLGAEVSNLQRADRKIDLIFRPSTRVALSTTELSEIYGGEIVFKDYPVTRNAETDTTQPAEAEPKTTTEPAPKP